METSAPRALAVESFSYSWLSNPKTPLDSLFDELDSSSQDFDFDVPNPISNSPIPFNHADELFSHGLIKPLSAYPSFSSTSAANSCALNRFYCHAILRRWRKSSRRMIHKFLSSVLRRRKAMTMSKKSTRVEDIDTRELQVSRRNDIGCEIESSIYEAVLHCKRSIEK